MWKVILGNRKQELKTAKKIVRALQWENAADIPTSARVLLVHNFIRELIVELVARINKKEGGKK